jgi:hypothetical protein
MPKLAGDVAVLVSKVTLIGPGAAPAGTVVEMLVVELTVQGAVASPKFTVHGAEKFRPLRLTAEPTGPDAGVKPCTSGNFRIMICAVAALAIPPAWNAAMQLKAAAPASAVRHFLAGPTRSISAFRGHAPVASRPGPDLRSDAQFRGARMGATTVVRLSLSRARCLVPFGVLRMASPDKLAYHG